MSDLLRGWIEDSLDIYKPELRRLLWPVFVYSFLNAFLDHHNRDAEAFYLRYKDLFVPEHDDDLRSLGSIRLPEHLDLNDTAKLYRSNKYRLSLTSMAFQILVQFLESKEFEGGSIINLLLANHFDIKQVERAAAGIRSFQSMIERANADDEVPAEDEGIPGHNPGSANTDPNAPTVLPHLRLRQPPMDTEAAEDVLAQLQEEDTKNPPLAGQPSLVEEFEQKIKQEDTDVENVPSRDAVPLPPPLSRDVAMEVQKIKENRDRFKIEKTTGGVGPGVSVVMYTFHNTFGCINSLDFSGDNSLVAAGMNESYIRVWTLDGSPLPSLLPTVPGESPPKPVSSRRLIGHAGPVYAVSFSPSTANPSNSDSDDTPMTNGEAETVLKGPSTKPQLLLSSSADKTIRLWSLDTWSCLVAYRAHDAPVWSVSWGPFGYYFASCGHDRTARLWATDHIEPLRMFVGHENDVDVVEWHPNGSYVFTASCDKTVRMWDVQRGTAVRMFTGHLSPITAVSCSTDGKTLASADESGAIFLWDLKDGSRLKRMRGHGKGGIYSLSWSAESTVLVSGGADGTVRVWDCVQRLTDTGPPGNASLSGPKPADGVAKDGTVSGASAAVGSKKGKKDKDAVVTNDQVGAFPTKESPVYKVQFTRMNLVVAGGAYLPKAEKV